MNEEPSSPPQPSAVSELPPWVLDSRQAWADAHDLTRRLHDQGERGKRVVRALTEFNDEILLALFRASQENCGAEEPQDLSSKVSLVLHGGCGRREFAPFSDVDLMMLCHTTVDPDVAALARTLSQGINDSGFRLGFTVQTPRQACTLALHEPATFSSLTDSRFLVGSSELFENFMGRFKRIAQRRWSTALQGILRAREKEREQFGDTVYLLRPDIKKSRGALRDVHLVRWFGFVRFGQSDIDQLSRMNAISSWDAAKLNAASEFLLRLRIELHFHAGRADDRLGKNEQVRISEKFGYVSRGGMLPVEMMMGDYFRHSSEVRYCSDHFVAKCMARQSVANVFTPLVTRPVDEHFRMGLWQIGAGKNSLDLVKGDLELVLRLMQLANLHDKEIDHPTWEAIRQSMTDAPNIQMTEACAARFMALLANTNRLAVLLRRLHETRVLEKIIPGFRHARNLLQFNEYHQYTVDEHSIRAVECATEFENDPGELGNAYRSIRDKEVLHLALLLHDLGKGFNEDHSEVGMRLADDVTRRLGLSDDNVEIVKFLVFRHLMMDHLAMRRDINDEATVAEFAATVGSINELSMLFVLTCADISAVGPNVLSKWKLGLLTDLYLNAKNALMGRSVPAHDPHLKLIERQITETIEDPDIAETLKDQAKELPPNYTRDHSPEQIVDQLASVMGMARQDFTCWVGYLEHLKATELCIVKSKQLRSGIFYQITGMLASCGLKINAADIKPLSEDWVWYRFQFEDREFVDEPPEARLAQIETLASEVISGARNPKPSFSRLWQIGIGSGPAVDIAKPELRVQIDSQTDETATIVDLFGYHKLGLLYRISKKIYTMGLDVRLARTSTYGHRVVFVFYLTDENGDKVRDARRLVEIRRTLLEEMRKYLEDDGTKPGDNATSTNVADTSVANVVERTESNPEDRQSNSADS